MISLVILSHSYMVAKGINDMIFSLVDNINVFFSGGNENNDFGSDYNKIKKTLEDAYSDQGVLIFFDLGSPLMTAQMIIDEFEESIKKKYFLIDAPIMEGSIIASIDISLKKDILKIISHLSKMKLNKL